MIFPTLKGISSPDLPAQELPANIYDCAVLIDAEIGPDGPGGDIFSFTAVTPSFLARQNETRWGRGCLVLPVFSWEAVEQAVKRLLSHAARETWDEVAAELGKELRWEFENYNG